MQSSTPEEARRPRLALVVSHPIQHFCPMYRAIAEDGRVELRVLFAEDGPAPRFDPGFGRTVEWQTDLLTGFDSAANPEPDASAAARTAWTLAELERFDPDIVYVHGYALPYLRAAMRWARRRRVPVLMTTDSELLHPRPLLTRVVKRLALPRVLRDVTTFLTVGDENERYFRHYGVPATRFHRTPFSIDSPFYDSVLARRDQVRADFRSAHNIPADAVVLLTVGKLIPRKAQADLLRAFAAARPQLRSPAVLLIAGDGPDRAQLETLAANLGLMSPDQARSSGITSTQSRHPERSEGTPHSPAPVTTHTEATDLTSPIRFLGFIGVDNLPACYIAADLYVHPSDHDPHPLAISEALYCSLPVIASDRIGSVGPTDDVQPGRNADIYLCHDIEALAALLTTWINHPETRAAAAAVSRHLGEQHAAPAVAGRFVDAALQSVATAGRTG